MTVGVFEHNNTRYCLVPEKPLQQGSYWTNGPSMANPLNRDGQLVLPTGQLVEHAVPIQEADVWSPLAELVTISNWPVYPFSIALLQLAPPDVIDQIIQRTVVHTPNSSGDVAVEINWNGLKIAKVYKLIQLGAGCAVWPPKVIPNWKYFYFLFATGDTKLKEQRTEIFSGLTPVVYGYELDASQRAKPRGGETRVTNIRQAAYSRIDVPPRWIVFRSGANDANIGGVLPIHILAGGDLAMPGRTGRARSSFAWPVPTRHSGPKRPAIRLSVDFGTSNTAVAILSSEHSSPTLLAFDSGLQATNLTRQVGLDPTLILEYASRFFPVNTTYSNPLPTILFESTDVEAFSGSDFLPLRGIPEFSVFTDNTIQNVAGEGFLKQDFKWKKSEDSVIHRRAYLEHLALLAGWALRTGTDTAQQADLDVTFTCPLAFTPSQTNGLKTTVSVYLETLRSCGLLPAPMRPLVSESLANLAFVRAKHPKGRFADNERHVVIDIGGGTTDISVFTGKGKPLLLDSLYVGGKDVAGSLLLYRITRQKGWEAITRVLSLRDKKLPAHKANAWAEMAHSLLTSRMATDIDKLADELGEEMPELLSEILALLVFVTLYGVRMAANSTKGAPPAESIHVWYAGLGSRLFRLAPLAAKQMDRVESARKILGRAVSKCTDLSKVKVTFEWSYGKESVCLGSLLVSSDSDSGDDLELSTVWWAEVPSAEIQWHNIFESEKAKGLSESQIQELKTDALGGCFRIAVSSVSELTLDRPRFDESRMNHALEDISDAFARGCRVLQNAGSDAPRHPVRSATDQIKEEGVCKLME